MPRRYFKFRGGQTGMQPYGNGPSRSPFGKWGNIVRVAKAAYEFAVYVPTAYGKLKKFIFRGKNAYDNAKDFAEQVKSDVVSILPGGGKSMPIGKKSGYKLTPYSPRIINPLDVEYRTTKRGSTILKMPYPLLGGKGYKDTNISKAKLVKSIGGSVIQSVYGVATWGTLGFTNLDASLENAAVDLFDASTDTTDVVNTYKMQLTYTTRLLEIHNMDRVTANIIMYELMPRRDMPATSGDGDNDPTSVFNRSASAQRYTKTVGSVGSNDFDSTVYSSTFLSHWLIKRTVTFSLPPGETYRHVTKIFRGPIMTEAYIKQGHQYYRNMSHCYFMRVESAPIRDSSNINLVTRGSPDLIYVLQDVKHFRGELNGRRTRRETSELNTALSGIQNTRDPQNPSNVIGGDTANIDTTLDSEL